MKQLLLKFKSKDFILAFAALCVLLGVLLAFFQDKIWGTAKRQIGKNEVLAKIVELKSDVKYKEEGKFKWSESFKNLELINKDRVLTGSASSATIKFNDSSNFSIQEDSIVVIEKNENGIATLTLETGSISGVAKENIEINVKQEDGTLQKIELKKDTKLNVSKKAGQKMARIKVERGVAAIKQRGEETIKVTEGKTYTMPVKQKDIPAVVEPIPEKIVSIITPTPMAEKTPDAIDIPLIAPKNEDSLWANQNSSVEFTWAATSNEEQYILIVSESSALTERPLKIRASNNTVSVNGFPHGRSFFWALFDQEAKTKLSETRSFSIKENFVPELISPEPYAKVTPQKTNINFKWNDQGNAKTFKFQLLKIEENGAKTKIAKDIDNNEFPLTIPEEEGRYKWRVKVVDHEREGVWSDYAEFTRQFPPKAEEKIATPPPLENTKEEAVSRVDQHVEQTKSNFSEETKEKIRLRKQMAEKNRSKKEMEEQQRLATQTGDSVNSEKMTISNDQQIFGKHKNSTDKLHMSIFYTASKGVLEETVSGVTVENSQNSPATIGTFLSYEPTNKFSLSSSAYLSKITNTETMNGKVYTTPLEYGINGYLGYKLYDNLSIYSGADYENLSTYNTAEVLSGQELEISSTKFLYATVGASLLFDIGKLLMLKGSYSNAISSYDGSGSFSGDKFILYLSMKWTDNLLFHLLYKRHMFDGPTDLTIYRYGVGIGYNFF